MPCLLHKASELLIGHLTAVNPEGRERSLAHRLLILVAIGCANRELARGYKNHSFRCLDAFVLQRLEGLLLRGSHFLDLVGRHWRRRLWAALPRLSGFALLLLGSDEADSRRDGLHQGRAVELVGGALRGEVHAFVAQQGLRVIDGDREANHRHQAARELGVDDPEHFALLVDQRPAAVAGVHRRVNLDDLLGLADGDAGDGAPGDLEVLPQYA